MDKQPFIDALINHQSVARLWLSQNAGDSVQVVDEMVIGQDDVASHAWLEREDAAEGLDFEPIPLPGEEVMRNGHPEAANGSPQQNEQARELYKRTLKTHYESVDDSQGSQELANLQATHDALEEVFGTYRQAFEKARSGIRRVLSAWALTAAHETLGGWPLRETDIELHEKIFEGRTWAGNPKFANVERRESSHRDWAQEMADSSPVVLLVSEALFIWELSSKPSDIAPPGNLHAFLEQVGDLLDAPEWLTLTTYAGLLYYLSQAAGPFQKLEHIGYKYLATKKIRRAVLLDEEPPRWEDVAKEMRSPPGSDKRTRHKRRKEWIVERVNHHLKEGLTSDKAYGEVIEEYAEEFDVAVGGGTPSKSTIRRYIGRK